MFHCVFSAIVMKLAHFLGNCDPSIGALGAFACRRPPSATVTKAVSGQHLDFYLMSAYLGNPSRQAAHKLWVGCGYKETDNAVRFEAQSSRPILRRCRHRAVSPDHRRPVMDLPLQGATA
jgi:hypothetical protein